MVLTLRQWSDYKSSIWAAAVPGLLLSLSNTSSAGSLPASSLWVSFCRPFYSSTWVSACIPPCTMKIGVESRNRQSYHWLLDPRVVCPKIAFVLRRGILGMQISKIKLRTCNSNLLFVNTNFLCKSSAESFNSFCDVEPCLFLLGQRVRFGFLTVMIKISILVLVL